VYLVRIKVEGDEVRRGDYHGKVKLGMAGQVEKVKLGMAGQVEIVTEQKSIFLLLIHRIQRASSGIG
jgi:hypothetical protein